ncbi:hypothetical protein [Pseudonocardia broussonetiae]|uniref:PNPLA domain-containing protein n=1 Tax=Pseudonocardia broussonetiae TaxID=2736640 RepID=A0A6M6JBX7_9PSEU|nr:hypothetical protein [Pseudonocardia broussonetiae]QJY44603.1 hypothetical protein HOP40_01105 [Pseudonocardia broussonetiae]
MVDDDLRGFRDAPPHLSEALTLVLAVLATATFIALGEIERLVRDWVTVDGRSAAVSDVLGPLALADAAQERSAWTVWAAEPAGDIGITRFLVGHTAVDTVFVIASALLLLRLLCRVGAAGRTWRVLLLLLVLAEGLEAVGLLTAAFRLDPDVRGTVLLAGVSTAKWALAGALAVVVWRQAPVRERIVQGVRRAGSAVWVQRLSAVSVLLIGALSLAPVGEILDQMPDAQRAWLDQDGPAGAARAGGWHLGAAVVMVALFAVVLFFQGRWRARKAWTVEMAWTAGLGPFAPEADPLRKGRYFWWLLAPVGVATAAALVWWRSGAVAPVDGQALAVFLAVPASVVLASVVLGVRDRDRNGRSERRDALGSGLVALALLGAAWALGHGAGTDSVGWAVAVGGGVLVLVAVGIAVLMARGGKDLWSWPGRGHPTEAVERDVRLQRAGDVRVAGDLLSFGMLVVAGLGLVRSFVAPLFVPAGTPPSRYAWQLVLVAFGLLLALGAPYARLVLITWIDRDPLTTGSATSRDLRRLLRPDSGDPLVRDPRPARALATALPVAFGVLSVLVLVALVTRTEAVTARVGVVGTAVLALGSWAVLLGFFIVSLQDRQPLEVFRFLRLTANPVLSLVVAVLLLVSLSGGDPDLHEVRTTAGDAGFAGRPALREVFVAWVRDGEAACPEATVRPLVLVAASGGGVRAAVWTAGVMDALRELPCGPGVLFSSGVSGGSVGLALSRAPDALDAATRLSGPDALASGIAGALVGDVAAAVTGVRLSSGGAAEWRDRAGLMESSWEGAADVLDEPFGGDVRGPGGALILNSTAAGPGCRVLVSQIDLTAGPDLPGCQGSLDGLPAATLDLGAYERCLGRMTWATAAMLSARFPFVTPAGRVDCEVLRPDGARAPTDLQLVDGGYAEGTGIATVADLAPAVADLVREHNATVPADGAIVVPLVLYLEDETRSDVIADPPDLAPELLVPVVGGDAAGQLVRTDAWLQRSADALADPCPAVAGSRCEDAVRVVRQGVPGGVVLAAPATVPGVSSPLGWTLSDDSRRQLAEGLRFQISGCAARTAHYACLEDLLRVLGRA